MDNKDYYKILGIDKKASQDEIKKAYRTLAVKYHPDKNNGKKEAEDKFKTINEANEVLSNPDKRKQYDELGENWQQTNQGTNPNRKNPFNNGSGNQQYYNEGNSSGFGNEDRSDFSEFFEQFFAGKAGNERSSQSRKGGDYETEMDITLEEAFLGTSRIIQLENEKLRITTKPGTSNDQLLRIKSKGGKGSTDALRGDLFVHIKVKNHKQFQRKGNDLYINHIIDLYTAVLGGEAIVNTLSGKVKIKVTEGTQNDKTIRIKGKGMPIYEKADTFGDLYIQLQVQIPDKLTEKQRELFETIQSSVQP